MERHLEYPYRATLRQQFNGYVEGHVFEHAKYFELPLYGPWVVVRREDGSTLSVPGGLIVLEVRYFKGPDEEPVDKNAPGAAEQSP